MKREGISVERQEVVRRCIHAVGVIDRGGGKF